MAKKLPFDSQNTVFLIDGSSFLYRAFYSLPPMHAKDGRPVQVVYGFCRMIKKMLNQFKPNHIAVVWDPSGGRESAVRAQLYEQYKAQRQASPNELNMQRDMVKDFVKTIGMQQIELSGIEADDILYAVATDMVKDGHTVVIVTSDKDMRQMVNDSIIIYDPFRDNFLDIASIETRYGFPISKIKFYFSILGDASDNIPGVKGIGEKGATELVQKFDSLKHLYENLESIEKPRTRQLLEASKENAFISEQLFALYYVPVNVRFADCVYEPHNWFNARNFFKEFDFISLLKDFPPQTDQSGEPKSTEEMLQARMIAITDPIELDNLCRHVKEIGYCAIDTETDSLDAMLSTLIGVSIATQAGTAYYVPIGHKHAPQQLPRDIVIEKLKTIFEDTQITKILHHAKFDAHVLAHAGMNLANIAFDTLIAANLVTRDWQRVSLKWLSEFYLHQTMLSYEDVVTKHKLKDFSEVPLDRATIYAASDVHQTLALKNIMEKELLSHEQEALFHDIEMPTLRVLYAMEKEGVLIDQALLKTLNTQAEIELKAIEESIHALLPEGFESLNLNSPKQLADLLFNALQLPPVKKTTGKKAHSTDQEVLEELSKLHPVPALIVKYREIFKIKSTYIDALLEAINPKTGKIHTSYSQTNTATGRLASFSPNLQNIPTGTTAGSMPIRSAFIPEPGHVFISADYSQVELRVCAYLSQDAHLLEIFKNNQDIHTQTAAKLFEVDLKEVKPEQRSLAKLINFSILYGLSPFGLAKELDIPQREAKLYIERFFAQYPGVVSWMEDVVQETKDHGYVTTLWGRRRYLPGIHDRNRNIYELARRMAINTKVQGTQAELMKIGMVKLHKALNATFPQAKLLLQIHDELLISAPESCAEEVKQLIIEKLHNVVLWNVPLLVTTRIGKNWQEVTK